jgi:hypothetical protein
MVNTLPATWTRGTHRSGTTVNLLSHLLRWPVGPASAVRQHNTVDESAFHVHDKAWHVADAVPARDVRSEVKLVHDVVLAVHDACSRCVRLQGTMRCSLVRLQTRPGRWQVQYVSFLTHFPDVVPNKRKHIWTCCRPLKIRQEGRCEACNGHTGDISLQHLPQHLPSSGVNKGTPPGGVLHCACQQVKERSALAGPFCRGTAGLACSIRNSC